MYVGNRFLIFTFRIIIKLKYFTLLNISYVSYQVGSTQQAHVCITYQTLIEKIDEIKFKSIQLSFNEVKKHMNYQRLERVRKKGGLKREREL